MLGRSCRLQKLLTQVELRCVAKNSFSQGEREAVPNSPEPADNRTRELPCELSGGKNGLFETNGSYRETTLQIRNLTTDGNR